MPEQEPSPKWAGRDRATMERRRPASRLAPARPLRARWRLLSGLRMVLAAGALFAPAVARPGHAVTPGPSVAGAQTRAELALVGQLGGDVRAVAWMGERVVIGVGPRVAVIDIAGPTAPWVIGQTGVLRGTVIALGVNGHIGYAIAGALSVVDLTDPTAPREIGFVEVGRHDSLYGWNGPARLAVGDGVVALAGGSVSRQGQPAFVDVRDPHRPLLASQLTTYASLDVAMDGHIAYVAIDADDLGQANQSVVVMDVRDPTSPREIGHSAAHGSAWRLALDGARLVVLGAGCPLSILDVTEPAAPTVARCGNPFGDASWWPDGTGLDMVVDGDTVVLVDRFGSLWFVDVSGVEMRPVGYAPGVPGGAQAFGAMAAAGHAGSSIEIAPYAIAVRRGQVLLAGGPYGLAVLDARDLADPRTLGSLDLLDDVDTRPNDPALVAGGHLAFVAMPGVTAPRVDIVDIADPANAHVVGTIRFAARQAALLGEDLVVLSDGAPPQSTLRVYDVSTPSLPVPLGALSLAGPTLAVVIDGAYAYVVDGSQLAVVDLRDPSQPVLARELMLDGGASDLAVEGGYAYAVSSTVLHVIDVHDAAAPVTVASVNALIGTPAHVAVDGGRVYVGEKWRLRAFDVRDPAAPTELWHMAVHSPPIEPIAHLLAEDGRLFAATNGGGLWVFDVRGDAATVLFTVPARAATVGVARAGDVVAVLDEYAHQDTGDDVRRLRLRLLDLTDAPDIRVLGGYYPSTAFHDAVLDGDIVYLAGATSGLHVVDVSDPAAPREVATLPVRGGVRQLVKAGSFLYGVTVRYGAEVHGAFVHTDYETRLCFVTVIDIADPLDPSLVGELARPEIRDIATASGRLYLADSGGLSVLDVATDPAHPREVGDIGSSRSGRGYDRVAVTGTRAFVVRAGGLDASRRPEPPVVRVIDVASPTRPSVTGDVVVGDTETLVRDLDVSGDHVYVSVLRVPELTGGLAVVDVRQPDTPQVVGAWEPSEVGLTVVPIEPSAVAVAGRYAFLSTYAGIRALDVIVPGFPVEVARLDTLEESLYDWLGIVPGQEIVAGADGRLYLPRGDAGLLVLGAVLPPRPTPTSGPSPTRTASATPSRTFTPLPSPTATVTPMPPTRGPTPSRTATATFGTRTLTPTSQASTPSPTAAGSTLTPDGTAAHGTSTPTTFATAGPSPTAATSATPSRTTAPEGTPTGTLTARPADSARIWLPVVARSL